MNLPIFDLPWWGYLLAALGLTHVTIVSITIYLHRHQAHRALELHPALAHFFRFWLWITTAMVTREWIAVHRKHHALVESEADPHSPQMRGISRVLWLGALLYRREADNRETLEAYGHGAPNDWLERRVYTPLTFHGPALMYAIDGLLFGLGWGLAVWSIQMLWTPFWAAGVINGIGHWCGYRNFETRDASRNIVPWGFWIGGEELHNNHHAYASSARFSIRPWEFDLGWAYLCLFRRLGLARINRTVPRLARTPSKVRCDLETARAVAANRIQVMSDFVGQVVNRVHREELRATVSAAERGILKRVRCVLSRGYPALDGASKARLRRALEISPRLHTVYAMKLWLQEIWNGSHESLDSLAQRLEEWCLQAEASGIQVLQEFSARLRGYTLAPTPA